MKKIFLSLILFILSTGCSSRDLYNAPEGFSIYDKDGISFTFAYPDSMEVTVSKENKDMPIVTVTSPSDPTYYYVLTGADNDTTDAHFNSISEDVKAAIETETSDTILAVEDFFDISDTIKKINNLDARVIEYSLIVPEEYFYNAIYKIPSLESDNFSYTGFVSATSDHLDEADIVMESMRMR